ncbi:MAG: molybdenum cofactor biosynthesis protein [Thermoplasmata archaeon]|nr:MAG: molybdenum cofactor biosynthesis protein [Thermoplasmata archaeon]
MRPFKRLISAADAFNILMENVRPIEDTEEIDILAALNRVLAEDVTASIDVPPFDRAAEDGYAVKAEDTFGASRINPKTLRIVGRVLAGEEPKVRVSHGAAVEIATGAMIPEGADAVVPVEETELSEDGKHVIIYRAVHPGYDVSKRGEDIKKGDLVLRRGTLLKPAQIGVLAALGLTKVRVYRKPKVAVIPTGDEVISPGKPLPKGKIYDVNTYTLSSIIIENGGVPIIIESVPDDSEDLRKALDKALHEADIVIFSGGSSVGVRDFLLDIFSERGKILFHGVKIKPGKPTLAAIIDEKLVMGFPGYPTSCLSNAYYFLVPVLRKIARLPEKKWRIVKSKMGHRITSTLGRMQILPVKIKGDIAVSVFKESGAITSLSNAEGFIFIPEDVDLVEKGDEVDVYMLTE